MHVMLATKTARSILELLYRLVKSALILLKITALCVGSFGTVSAEQTKDNPSQLAAASMPCSN